MSCRMTLEPQLRRYELNALKRARQQRPAKRSSVEDTDEVDEADEVDDDEPANRESNLAADRPTCAMCAIAHRRGHRPTVTLK